MSIKKIVPRARPFSTKAMFVVTSGKLNLGTSHSKASRILNKRHGFEVYSVGLGASPDKAVLAAVASEPVEDHTIFLEYPRQVAGAVKAVVDESKGQL